MNKLEWKPWHQVVRLRDDLRSGELSLAIFAADIYDVMMNKARPIYQDPKEFFSLTYPTFNLRELARDVVLRLAGRSDKAIRQLELTYGGGKTHALITMFHLVNEPDRLPDLPAVQEFTHHIGITPPKSCVAVKNEVQAFKVVVGDEPLFSQIKADGKSRIQDTPISADALLPGGHYDLWREGETSRRVKDLVGAFAQFRLRIELGGDISPSDEMVEKVNRILKDISKDIRFERTSE